MMKIKISEAGSKELNKFDFDIQQSLKNILEYLPKIDLIGLDHIYITDKPEQWKKHLSNAGGAYFEEKNNTPAYIEIYLSEMFSHIKSTESFMLMKPIQNIGLAQTVFHEVGHHIEKTRSHGINKNKREKYAEKYANNLLSKYLTANADSINSCFKYLENVADEKGLSHNIIERMKSGWEKQFKGINN